MKITTHASHARKTVSEFKLGGIYQSGDGTQVFLRQTNPDRGVILELEMTTEEMRTMMAAMSCVIEAYDTACLKACDEDQAREVEQMGKDAAHENARVAINSTLDVGERRFLRLHGND